MKNKIICLGREYGSGGREIGERLAKNLGIACYDKLIVSKTASENSLSESVVESDDEKPIGFGAMISGNIFADSAAFCSTFYSEEERIFEAERKTILELAGKGPCVMIGRCASSILEKAGFDTLSVFIYADEEARIKRICSRAGLSEKAARHKLHEIDRMRREHFEFYSETEWGKPESYDLMLSSGRLGIDGAVGIIAAAVEN